MGLDDSSCDTVLVLGLALYDGTTPVPVASSIGDEYSRRRLQLKKEHHRQQPIVVTAGSDVQHYDAAPLEPSLTLALSAEVGGYGVDGKGKGETGRPGQVVDYQYSSSSTMFPQQHQLLQYTSCRSLSLSSPSASTFSNSCLSSGAAVKRERVDAAPHHAVVAGDEAEGTDVDDKALEVVPTSPHAAVADDFDGDVAASSARKKLRLTKEQSALLEERFKEQSTLNPKQKLALAKQLNLRPRQVEVWFQNRRARTKLKQTEVDCEFLRRCCETLADENRRLHRELQELKAIKFTAAAATISATAPSPPSSLQYQLQVPGPATAAGSTAAFTMCPGCQRISPAAGTDVVKQAAAKATSTAAGFAVAPKAGHVM